MQGSNIVVRLNIQNATMMLHLVTAIKNNLMLESEYSSTETKRREAEAEL